MALGLYGEPNVDSQFTSTGPFTVTFDGRIGGIIDRQVYVRNDDTRFYYTDISVQIVDTGAASWVNNDLQGYYWKLARKDIPLSHEEWQEIAPNNTLSFPDDIGDSTYAGTATYLPFWVRIATNAGTPITTRETIYIQINATENLI